FLSQRDTAPAEGWREVAAMGLWTYALSDRKEANQAVQKEIRERSVAVANKIAQRTVGNPYRVSLTAKDYVWGSNGVAASYGVQLLVANAFARDRRLVDAALDDLHYLLGRNTFSLSWVTQVGENPYRHPHHRPSGADHKPEPWTGMISVHPTAAR